jgi:hypothetical protein
MRLSGTGLGAALFIAAVTLPACGGGGGGGSGGSGGGTGGVGAIGGTHGTGGSSATGGTHGTGGSSGFTPATEPADICSLLTLADAQTILPSAGAGVVQPVIATADVWMVQCDWDDPSNNGKSVELILEGALTATGNSDLDGILRTAGTGATQSMMVSGLGDGAIYVNTTGIEQILEARSGSYLVNVTAVFITPDVTASPLQPLVQKVISGL